MTATVGMIAAIVTVIFVFVGITAQIYKNWKMKSTDGLSFPFFSLSFIVWCSWSIYGALLNDIFMAVAQGIGALMTLIILFQFFYSKKRS